MRTLGLMEVYASRKRSSLLQTTKVAIKNTDALKDAGHPKGNNVTLGQLPGTLWEARNSSAHVGRRNEPHFIFSAGDFFFLKDEQKGNGCDPENHSTPLANLCFTVDSRNHFSSCLFLNCSV